MKKIIIFGGVFICTLLLISCKSYFPVTFLTKETHVEIYVNDEYVGTNMATYRVPSGTNYVTVKCIDNGREVLVKEICVKGMKNRLIELSIPEDFKYSNGQTYKPIVK